MNLSQFKSDVREEVSTILSSDFAIDVSDTHTVPHSSDAAITFPNLDQKVQRTKLIETTVLYVDMRRSTALNLKHRRPTVAKLYSAFVRAMTRCAGQYGGEVRGIIGDRVMILFDSQACFERAVNTATLINSVGQYVLNRFFSYNEVKFGVGIDYGRMLVTKTGIRRHGAIAHSYRSLVWLGQPANIASKLTDIANKPATTVDLVVARVAYQVFGQLIYQDEYPQEFIQKFNWDPATGLMRHSSPVFHSFTWTTRRFEDSPATPPILMTKRVFDGFRSARPKDIKIRKNWIFPIAARASDYDGELYGSRVVFKTFDD